MPVEVLENPVTGERIEVLEAPSDANGQRARMRFSLAPGGRIAGAQAHPGASQTFYVESGALHVRVATALRVLQAGESAVAPAGVVHDQWNEGDVPVVVIEDSQPASHALPFLRALFALAKAGETDAAGRPNLLMAAAIFTEYRDAIRPEPFALRLIVRALAPVAGLLGYRARARELGRPG
jgi:mannose-6-phosphate isomerase-like protein (cupin superfamily)